MPDDAFHASRVHAAAVRQRNHGIAVVLPNIPLWVPADARQQIGHLVVDTVRLALITAAGYIGDAASGSADTGHLAASFQANPATRDGGIEVSGDGITDVNGRVFSSLPYAIVIDQGRRPGSPISREGIDAIGLWAQRKLGLSAEEADRAKWPIAISIIQQGFSGTGYFEDGVDAATPPIQQLFEALSAQIAVKLTSEGGRQAG